MNTFSFSSVRTSVLRAASARSAGLLAPLVLGLFLSGPAVAQSGISRSSGVYSPNSHAYGQSYAEWSGAFWRWSLELPVDGHPFVDSAAFDVTAGQSGDVWFLGTPIGDPTVRFITVPDDKALFVATLCSEWSSLEGFPTEDDQRSSAVYFGDHIVGMSASLDGRSVRGIDDYRFTSPQIDFDAPSPWIFGETGGAGTTVADGYYLFLKPLSVGTHVLHYQGVFHFSIAEGDPFDGDFGADVTYVIEVVPH
jgi:hypothetical protein